MYQVGRGIGDVTGEPAGVGMLGYGKAWQRTSGIHTRLRCRAFLIVDGARRVLLVVAELPLIFDSVHRAVLDALDREYPGKYSAANVMITATHTHCGPGGYSHHRLYNSTTGGFRPATFAAIVDGILDAIRRAHDDLAPAGLSLAHGELRDASANRSRVAFELNPAQDRAFFPDAIDPRTTVLRVTRAGQTVAAINFFPTHNTSMTHHNTLISSDNKGYAAALWERAEPGLVAAFAQTNAGDMSPNLNLRPGSGPTEDEVRNTELVGQRQYEAASALGAGERLEGGLGAVAAYVDLSSVLVEAEFTGDGRKHRTSGPFGGAAALAGAWSDGVGFAGFREGRNPFWDALSRRLVYRLSPRLADSQAPKGLVLPGGLVNRFVPMVAHRVPVQLLRIGGLYLLGIPAEVTIVAGLRLRRTVASLVGADVSNVLVVGYSNAYVHYLTTPQEYAAQQYEGGSTLFGRWELPAFQQVAAELAQALLAGGPVVAGSPPPPVPVVARPSRILPDEPPAGHAIGDVLVAPLSGYRRGQRSRVVFAGAHPNNDLRRGGSYLDVQVQSVEGWRVVATDADWCTRFRWTREGRASSVITITWDIPLDTLTGTHRIRYHGDARHPDHTLHPFTALSPTFQVLPCRSHRTDGGRP